MEKLNYLPFRKGGLLGTSKKVSKEEKGELKEPILMLMRENGDTEIYENVKSGLLTIKRGNENVEILLPTSKKTSWPWGSRTIRGWIASEQEAIAYPPNIIHDSLSLKRIINQMQTNYKNFKAQEINAFGKWIVYLIVGIILALVVAGLFGVNVADVITPTVQQIPETPFTPT